MDKVSIDRTTLSMYAESFIHENVDPNVLASSILVGEVRKSDLRSELEDMDRQQQNDDKELDDAEGTIARLIQKVVSSLKASVNNVTIRFEFPSELKLKKNNVLLLHFPKLEYADETPVPTGNDAWFPSLFIYSFLFEGFFVQIFDEDATEDEEEQTNNNPTSSVHVDDQQQSPRSPDIKERHLDVANTIIFGRAENNKIRIKLITADNNSLVSFGSGDSGLHDQSKSKIEIQFNISSIHAVFTPSQMKIMIEIMERMTKTMSTTEEEEEDGEDLHDSFQPTSYEDFYSKSAYATEAMQESIHESMYESIHESMYKTSIMEHGYEFANLEESMHEGDHGFKPVEIDSDDDEDLFHSIMSEKKEAPKITKKPVQRKNNQDDVRLHRFRDNSDFPPIESSPVSLQIIIKLQGATINLLYEDSDLGDMWRRFRANQSLKHSEGPNISVNHLVLRCADLVVKSVNNNDTNSIEVGIGDFSIFERLKKPQAQESKSLSSLIANYMKQEFSSEKKEEKIVEFCERRILQFLPSNKTDAPRIAVLVQFNRQDNRMSCKTRLDALQLSIEAGIVERLVYLFKDIKRSRKIQKQIVIQQKDKNKLDSDVYSDDTDYEDNPFTSDYELKMDHVQIEIFFPEDGTNHQYTNHSIRVDLHQMDWNMNKVILGSDLLSLNAKIAQLAVYLCNSKIPSESLQPVVNASKVNATIYNKTTQTDSKDDDSENELEESNVDLDTESDSEFSDEPVTPPAAIEVIVSDEKIFRSAALGIQLTMPTINISLSKEEFIMLQKLPQFFGQQLTVPLDKLNELINDHVENDMLSSSKSRSVLHILTESDEPNERPNTAIKLIAGQLNFLMKKSETNSFRASLHDVSAFAMLYPKSRIGLNLNVKNLSVTHNLLDKQLSILSKSERVIKNYRENMYALAMNLKMSTPEPKIQKIALKLQTNGLYHKHHFYPKDQDWIALVSDFFQSDEVYDGEMIISLDVLAQNTIIDYSPVGLPSRLLVLVDRIGATAQMIQSAEETNVSVDIVGVSVLIHNNFKYDVIHYLKTHNVKSELGFMSDLKALKFAYLLSVNNIDISIKALNSNTQPSRERPAVLVEVSNGTLTLSFCSDSFKTLQEMLTYIGNQGDLPVTTPASNETEHVEDEQNMLDDFSVHIHDNNFILNIDENAFSASSNRSSLYPSASAPSSQAQNKVQIGSGYGLEDPEADDSIKLFTNFNIDLMKDYFPTPQHEDYSINRILSPQYPIAQFELLVRKDVNVVVYLYEGQDWPDHTQKRRNQKQSVSVNLLDCFLQFHLFDQESDHEWRLRVSLGDIEVLDKLQSSNRNKVICYWKNPSMPRETGSRMLDLVLECLRPSSRQEMRLNLSLLPIRLNFHQNTLMFLLLFFEVSLYTEPDPSPASSSTPKTEASPSKAPDMYFQSFKLSEISLCVDYQPTEVNYGRLAEKQVIEFVNFIPLSGVEINLSNIDLRAVQGFNQLSERITEQIISDIYGTQAFRFLLGLMPVRSLYNVGSGAVDLFILPIQQYQKDGRVLRGIRQGITSFVTNASVESVSLGATTMSGINYVIEAATNFLSGSSTPSTQQNISSAPAANLTEGLQRAYSDLSGNYEDAKFAVLAIPHDDSGATVGALRAVPRVILSPFAGITSAASNVLSGIEATFRPKDEDLFKNYSMQ